MNHDDKHQEAAALERMITEKTQALDQEYHALGKQVLELVTDAQQDIDRIINEIILLRQNLNQRLKDNASSTENNNNALGGD